MFFSKPKPEADICLLLEGTYPYVSGGVSTWVHQIITAYPQWKFAILHIGSQRDAKVGYKYEIPANVISITEIYLFDPTPQRLLSLRNKVPSDWSEFYKTLRQLFVHSPDGSRNDFRLLAPLFEKVAANPSVSFEVFWHDRETWKVLREIYEHYASEESFLHFFWTARYLIEPLWKIACALPSVPRAKVYHTACTGYAGILGALLSKETGAPLLLSEHGIYLKERIADICRSKWIPDALLLRPGLNEPLGNLRRLWIGFFDLLGRICYDTSTQTVSLFGANARLQEHFGAHAEKIMIIPNGIATENCDALYEMRAKRRHGEPESCIVGFLGRVVPIKDVKTLLRAARLVCDAVPHARFLIAGPTSEDPEYFQECQGLAQQLQLTGQVDFVGLCQRDDVLPLMDVMVLTSISEGLPFVVIESMASGVPLVCTDAGACRELLEGTIDEKSSPGASGLVAPVGDTEQIARALIRLLTDPALQQRMSEAGRIRAHEHYHERRMLDAYESMYQKLMHPAVLGKAA